MMTMGSLFDGIGGFPLAAVRNGIKPIWASEIEAFPMEVTKIRFPQMLHVGDITKLKGDMLPSVDIICGGSPCQDLSVAGQRAGLAGERSGLFMEQARITKEMRKADEQRNPPNNIIRPRYLVWENVPGAFSSADGEDFRAVIEEIVRIKYSTCHVPRPASGRFESAGAVLLANEFSLAWRVLDAQYWGVPQRRRRIFLVADFGGKTALEILFKQGSVSWNSTQGRSSWQGVTVTTERSIDDTGKAIAFAANQRDEVRDLHDVLGALDTQPGMKQQTFIAVPTVCLNDHGGERMDIEEEMTPTLRAGMGGHPPLVMENHQCSKETNDGSYGITESVGEIGNDQQIMFENHPKDGRYNGPLCVAPTLAARMGTGGNNVPLVGKSQEAICIVGNIIDRKPQNGGNGLGYQPDIAYTLTATDHHAVFSRQRSDEFLENNIVGTQSARQYKDATDLICQHQVFGQSQFGNYAKGCTTLRAQGGDSGGGSENLVTIKNLNSKNLIRRLTPLECERLQGFPDRWTLIPGASDSVRYKALGNSVAIPCVEFIMKGIANFLGKEGE